ncbi:MAG: hypothetical protein LBJ88_04075 [Campylobacteraceae bacterium]|jgi:hypothetical protein|nr:hypothetical protein [Campylobacteraceae bacterium]
MEDIKKIVDEAVSNKVSILHLCAKKMTEQASNEIEAIKASHKEIEKAIEKSANTISNKDGHSDYIKYIVSSDFEKKEKELVDKVEQLILDKMAQKKDNNTMYIYMAMAALFIIQIALLIFK